MKTKDFRREKGNDNEFFLLRGKDERVIALQQSKAKENTW